MKSLFAAALFCLPIGAFAAPPNWCDLYLKRVADGQLTQEGMDYCGPVCAVHLVRLVKEHLGLPGENTAVGDLYSLFDRAKKARQPAGIGLGGAELQLLLKRELKAHGVQAVVRTKGEDTSVQSEPVPGYIESELALKDISFQAAKGEIEIIGVADEFGDNGHYLLVLDSRKLPDGSLEIDFVDPNFEGLQKASVQEKHGALLATLPKERYRHARKVHVQSVSRVKVKSKD